MASQSGYERGRDENRNTLASLVDDVSPDGGCCCCKYLLVPIGHDGLCLLWLLVIPHASPLSWNQLLVYQVVRRAAVHKHRELVADGVKTPVSTTS